MAYTKQTWQDLPSKTTPINASRLGHIEQGIYDAASTADTAASDASSAISGLADKVDKVEDKGLSTNDFTDALKTKLDNVEAGAEVNVQADYTQNDTTADDYIKNKPSLGTASSKNSTSVVTDSTDLVESGAVKDIVGWGNKNLLAVENGEYNTATCAKVSRSIRLRSTKILSLKAGTYVFSGTASKSLHYFYLIWQYGDRYEDNVKLYNSPWINVNVPFTLNTDSYVTIGIGYTDDANIDSSEVTVQFEKGSTATAYEPYHASVEETIPQVVSDAVGWDVGNLITGVVENYSIIADGTVTADNTFMYTNGSIVKPYHNYRFKAQSTNTASSNIRIHGYNSSGTWVKQITAALGVTTTADIKFYVDDPSIVSVKISLKKAFTEYTLTHFTVDETKADNSVIAPVENGSTASQAYAVGQHFIRDGAFCTCIQAIAQGGTFTLNTNYTAGDVASALEAIDVTSEFTFADDINFVTTNSFSKIYRVGNIIIGKLRFTTPSTVVTDKIVLSIPSKYIPKNGGQYLCTLSEQWTGTVCGILGCTNNSTIVINSSTWTANKTVLASFMYVI